MWGKKNGEIFWLKMPPLFWKWILILFFLLGIVIDTSHVFSVFFLSVCLSPEFCLFMHVRLRTFPMGPLPCLCYTNWPFHVAIFPNYPWHDAGKQQTFFTGSKTKVFLTANSKITPVLIIYSLQLKPSFYFANLSESKLHETGETT